MLRERERLKKNEKKIIIKYMLTIKLTEKCTSIHFIHILFHNVLMTHVCATASHVRILGNASHDRTTVIEGI